MAKTSHGILQLPAGAAKLLKFLVGANGLEPLTLSMYTKLSKNVAF